MYSRQTSYTEAKSTLEGSTPGGLIAKKRLCSSLVKLCRLKKFKQQLRADGTKGSVEVKERSSALFVTA